MNLRKPIIFLAFALSMLASPLWADRVRDQIVEQLQQQGYRQIVISSTWLGRTRIVAKGNDQRREIIVNPRTGEILRDFWESDDSDDNTRTLIAPDSRIAKDGRATGESDDDGGDDDSDDDGSDDDSGDDGGDDGDSDSGSDGDSDSDGDSGGDSDGGDGDGDGDGEGEGGGDGDGD